MQDPQISKSGRFHKHALCAKSMLFRLSCVAHAASTATLCPILPTTSGAPSSFGGFGAGKEFNE
jgi:hypothetical protein